MIEKTIIEIAKTSNISEDELRRSVTLFEKKLNTNNLI